jgi:hypothetical protein
MYNGMSYNDIFVGMNGIFVGIFWYPDIMWYIYKYRERETERAIPKKIVDGEDSLYLIFPHFPTVLSNWGLLQYNYNIMYKYVKLWYIYISGWWFGTFFIFPNSWDDDPIWLIFFRGVETTNQIYFILCVCLWIKLIITLCPDVGMMQPDGICDGTSCGRITRPGKRLHNELENHHF